MDFFAAAILVLMVVGVLWLRDWMTTTDFQSNEMPLALIGTGLAFFGGVFLLCLMVLFT